MALSDEDVREILRLIDESKLDELRIETAGFNLHVVRGAAAAEAAEPAPADPAAARPPGGPSTTIAAPMPGTFYRAEGPGKAPFVDVGARVEPDTVVCIIEIMKMMNSVPAGVSGTIVEVCADDAQLVGDGTPLFRVEVGG
jgi:acetyl-CoA carboxylase biotin carboxyl carrier protein